MKKLMIIFGVMFLASSSARAAAGELASERAAQAAAGQEAPYALAHAYAQAATELTEQQVTLAELIRQAQMKSAAMSASATNQEIEKERAELEQFNRQAQALSSNIRTTGMTVYNQRPQDSQQATHAATIPAPSSANTQSSSSALDERARLRSRIDELKSAISACEGGAIYPYNPYPRLRLAEKELARLDNASPEVKPSTTPACAVASSSSSAPPQQRGPAVASVVPAAGKMTPWGYVPTEAEVRSGKVTLRERAGGFYEWVTCEQAAAEQARAWRGPTVY